MLKFTKGKGTIYVKNTKYNLNENKKTQSVHSHCLYFVPFFCTSETEFIFLYLPSANLT